MWLAHGTAVVWEADPASQTVRVHRTGQPAQVLTLNDVLRDESLLPGFELAVMKLFRLP